MTLQPEPQNILSDHKEPDISVRLYTCGAPLLVPLGEFIIQKDEKGAVVYDPCNSESSLILENLAIGMGFHWHSTVSARFKGSVRVFRDEKTREWITVNVLPLEDYLQSVIASEMSAQAPLEFLKAHAVISRGWAVGKIYRRHSDARPSSNSEEFVSWENTSDHCGFDVCSDDHCQRYQGIDKHHSKNPIKAVEDTKGMILLDSNGKVADTRFSKCCGGQYRAVLYMLGRYRPRLSPGPK